MKAMYLYCDCCGADGAVSDARGYFFDGQPLICGCDGHVSCDAETDPYIYTSDECRCQEMEEETSACSSCGVYLDEGELCTECQRDIDEDDYIFNHTRE